MVRLFLYSPATNECSRTGVCRRKFPVFTSSGIFLFWKKLAKNRCSFPERTYILLCSEHRFGKRMFFSAFIKGLDNCAVM